MTEGLFGLTLGRGSVCSPLALRQGGTAEQITEEQQFTMNEQEAAERNLSPFYSFQATSPLGVAPKPKVAFTLSMCRAVLYHSGVRFSNHTPLIPAAHTPDPSTPAILHLQLQPLGERLDISHNSTSGCQGYPNQGPSAVPLLHR